MRQFNPNSIRLLRQCKGMTLEAFAESLGKGVSRQHVHQWETGKHEPRTSSLLRIVDAHGVSFDIFFEKDEQQSNHHIEALDASERKSEHQRRIPLSQD